MLILPGCGGGNDPEDQAKAIYSQAKALETQGDMLGALKEYDRLVDFPQTLTFATARDELLKQGYSLGAGMESWTSQLIVDMENELVSKGKEFDPQDGLVVRLPKTDAWGQYLWVEYSAGPKFVFRVMSAGPDGLPDTDDDLGIYHKPPPQVGTEQAPKPAGGPLDGRSVGDGEDSPDDPSAETAEPAPNAPYRPWRHRS